MPELVHAWSAIPAAIGTCCLVADRARVRIPELATSVIMALAMVDTVTFRLVEPLYWAAILIVGALAFAALRPARGSRHKSGLDSRQDRTGGGLHTPLGMILMAALLIAMSYSGDDAGTVGDATAHHHTAGHGQLSAVLVPAAALYLGSSLVIARSRSGWLARVEMTAMGTSAALMGAALLI
jgi:hypothetical protein